MSDARPSIVDRLPVALRRPARLGAITAVAMAVHEALAWGLAEVGLAARLLSPSPSIATYAGLVLLLVLYVLRLGLVFVAPPVLVVALVRGVLELLASGEAPAAPPIRDRPARRS